LVLFAGQLDARGRNEARLNLFGDQPRQQALLLRVESGTVKLTVRPSALHFHHARLAGECGATDEQCNNKNTKTYAYQDHPVRSEKYAVSGCQVKNALLKPGISFKDLVICEYVQGLIGFNARGRVVGQNDNR
jgi:hypothetical protein